MTVEVLARGLAETLVSKSTQRQTARRLRSALKALGRSRSTVSLVFTDDAEIRQLNQQFRNMKRATDVLSFHYEELRDETDLRGKNIYLGDIVISAETAYRRRELPMGQEYERLAIHGLCHLFGHDHKRKPEAEKMRSLEKRLLMTDQ